jgi:hypothetical protein
LMKNLSVKKNVNKENFRMKIDSSAESVIILVKLVMGFIQIIVLLVLRGFLYFMEYVHRDANNKINIMIFKRNLAKIVISLAMDVSENNKMIA